MTNPIPHDYPDWGRYLAQSDKVYFDQPTTNVDAITDFDLGFVGDVPFVHLRFDPVLNRQRVNLDFFSNAALTGVSSGYQFDVRNGTNVNQSVAVLGSFLRMRVEPSAVGSEFFASVKSMPAGGRVPGADLFASVLIAINNTSIGAGLAGASSAGNIWPGSAVWGVRTAATDFLAELRVRDFASVFTVIDSFDETSTERWRNIFLPPGQMNIQLTNNTGAAADFSWYLNARTGLFET